MDFLQANFVLQNVYTFTKMITDDFEWDDLKNSENLAKYGISFRMAIEIFSAPYFTFIDNRRDNGEIRSISIGLIAEIAVVVVAHTTRGNRIRIISARRANKIETEKYYAYLKKKIK